MITPEQVEEWLHEVEQRPSSAELIIRYISNRLRDLTARNEELLAENIALRSGRKVDEFEGKIANLEYQVELLKRQLSGAVVLDSGQPVTRPVQALSLLVYNTKGQVLRVEIPADGLQHGAIAAVFSGSPGDLVPRLVVCGGQEELLFVFDSGRSETRPVMEIDVHPTEGLVWTEAYKVEARAGEQLVAVLPIGRMSLYDCILQVSRRGCARKIMRVSFEQHLAKSYVGTGIRVQPDKTFCLALSGREDRLALVTREGWAASLGVEQLPYTAEEVLKLSATDYLTAAFVPGAKASIAVVTTAGKVIQREASWLEPVESFKSRGQALYSQSRRDAGARVAGAAALDEGDWGSALMRDGKITAHEMAAVFAGGGLHEGSQEQEVMDFHAFCPPQAGAK